MKSYNLLIVRNSHKGTEHFYIDGKRVTREAYRDLAGKAERFDCFSGMSRAGLSRQYCCAYIG